MTQKSISDHEVDSPRIQHIPYGRPKVVKPSPWVLVGIAIFLGSIFGPTLTAKFFGPDAIPLPSALRYKSEWVVIGGCLLGLLLIAIAMIRAGRRTRQHWVRVEARCLDWEYWRAESEGPESGKTWYFQMLCEFELQGQTYRVTPNYWSTFALKATVRRFLNKTIKNDICELYVNPDNPLQTELVGHDIKDVLLH